MCDAQAHASLVITFSMVANLLLRTIQALKVLDPTVSSLVLQCIFSPFLVETSLKMFIWLNLRWWMLFQRTQKGSWCDKENGFCILFWKLFYRDKDASSLDMVLSYNIKCNGFFLDSPCIKDCVPALLRLANPRHLEVSVCFGKECVARHVSIVFYSCYWRLS